MFVHFTFVSKSGSWTWWKLSVELVPATAVFKIAGSGQVSREGQYAIHKTLLGRSSRSVIPQLTAQVGHAWAELPLVASPNRRPRRT